MLGKRETKERDDFFLPIRVFLLFVQRGPQLSISCRGAVN